MTKPSLIEQLRAMRDTCPNRRDFRTETEYEQAYAAWLAEKQQLIARMDGEYA